MLRALVVQEVVLANPGFTSRRDDIDGDGFSPDRHPFAVGQVQGGDVLLRAGHGQVERMLREPFRHVGVPGGHGLVGDNEEVSARCHRFRCLLQDALPFTGSGDG